MIARAASAGLEGLTARGHIGVRANQDCQFLTISQIVSAGALLAGFQTLCVCPHFYTPAGDTSLSAASSVPSDVHALAAAFVAFRAPLSEIKAPNLAGSYFER